MTGKPNLSFWQLWNLSFGFFGVQIAYALQNANIGTNVITGEPFNPDNCCIPAKSSVITEFK